MRFRATNKLRISVALFFFRMLVVLFNTVLDVILEGD